MSTVNCSYGRTFDRIIRLIVKNFLWRFFQLLLCWLSKIYSLSLYRLFMYQIMNYTATKDLCIIILIKWNQYSKIPDKLKCMRLKFFICYILHKHRLENHLFATVIGGYINGGDGCWRQLVLVTSLRSWLPFWDIGEHVL